MRKTHQINFSYTLLALVLVVLFHAWWAEYSQVEALPYSEFEQLLRDGRVDEIQIREQYVEGRLRQPLADGRDRFITTRVDPGFAAHLQRYGVKFSGVVESGWLRDVLGWLLPTVFFVAVWLFLIRRMAEKQGFGGLMSIGKSHAKAHAS